MPSPLSKTRSENDPVQVMVVGDLVNGILMQDPRIQDAPALSTGQMRCPNSAN